MKKLYQGNLKVSIRVKEENERNYHKSFHDLVDIMVKMQNFARELGYEIASNPSIELIELPDDYDDSERSPFLDLSDDDYGIDPIDVYRPGIDDVEDEF